MEAIAQLKNIPISPRKIRLLADIVRKKKAIYALNLLGQTSKKGANYLANTIKSAISNWQQKNNNHAIEEDGIYIHTIRVDAGTVLKRINPAAQGRANRIKKRTSHITISVNHQKQ